MLVKVDEAGQVTLEASFPYAQDYAKGVLRSLTDDEAHEFKEMQKKANALEEVVCVFGSADREQIHKIAHSIDCSVVPSDYETFGLPALEALAAGKPVVTTRCNGPEWLVRDDRFGRCVDRGSSTALAEAMIEVYESRDEFDSDFIRTETWNNYSRTAVSRQWSDAIHEAVAKNRCCDA